MLPCSPTDCPRRVLREQASGKDELNCRWLWACHQRAPHRESAAPNSVSADFREKWANALHFFCGQRVRHQAKTSQALNLPSVEATPNLQLRPLWVQTQEKPDARAFVRPIAAPDCADQKGFGPTKLLRRSQSCLFSARLKPWQPRPWGARWALWAIAGASPPVSNHSFPGVLAAWRCPLPAPHHELLPLGFLHELHWRFGHVRLLREKSHRLFF